MNENEFQSLIQSIDQDLISDELDELLDDTPFDFDSISKKASDKLNKQISKKQTNNYNEKKKFRYSIAAAAIIMAVGTTVVYGEQISAFIKSILNKKQVYSSIVDGKAFYLPKLVELDDSFKLESLHYSSDQLKIVLIPKERVERISTLNISIKDKFSEYIVSAYAIYDDNKIAISFNNVNTPDLFTPNNEIKLNIIDKTYDIKLEEATDLNTKGQVKESISKNPDISIGYQKTSDGILVITNFVDSDMNLMSIGAPLDDPLKTIADFTNGTGSGNAVMTKALIGLDEQNNKYEFTGVNDGNSFPITLFSPNKEVKSKVQLQIPSLIISYKKEVDIPNLKLDIPDIGKELEINKEFDLILQKMVLDKIIRTSNTTAELKFNLNTGDRKDIEIRDVFSYCTNVKTIEATWEGNVCTMVLTIDDNVTDTELTIASPYFTINGDWVLDIE